MPETSFSIASLSTLPPEAVKAVLAGLTDRQCDELLHDWRFNARPQQLSPAGDWDTWLVLAGRGFGKTRTGAEWVREEVKRGVGRATLIAPTAADARDIMVEGESGLLSVCWKGDIANNGDALGRPLYEPSKRRLTWANGAMATLYSAEEPERLRGPQSEIIWGDELAAWKYMRETWDMAQFGLRLGTRPRALVTTTPKPRKLLREIIADERTIVTKGSTYDNAANLAAKFLATMRSKYEGTTLGKQELYAALMEEADGALWTRKMVSDALHSGGLPKMRRVVIGVDPAITANEESDATGIVAAGLGEDGHGYVIEDRSARLTPGDWAKRTVKLFHKWEADRIIAEGNQGGEMVRHTIQTEWSGAPVSIVHASRGKQARAEPVAALYEQNRVRHLHGLADLEDEMCNWEPLSGMASPDRLDAMVWALTDLMVTGSTYTLNNL